MGWESVSDWYVDEQNSSGNASDSNAGLTALAPLASCAELTRRIGTAYLQQTTTVHLISDVEDDSSFAFTGQIATPEILRIIGEGETELLAATVLTGVQNIVVNTSRPYIQVTGIDWNTAGPGGTSLLNKRCRVTAGVASHIGALFWIEEIDSGDPSIAYINRPFLAASSPAFGVSRSLSIGDTIVVEELTKAGGLNIQFKGNGIVGFSNTATCVSVEHIKGPGTTASLAVLGVVPFDQGVTTYGCDLNWGRIVCNFGNIMASQLGSGLLNMYLSGNSNTYLSGCSIATMTSFMNFSGPGSFTMFNSCSFNSSIFLSSESGFVRLYCYDDVSIWSWPSNSGLVVNQGCHAYLRSRLWGSSSNANTYGISVDEGGHIKYEISSPPTIFGTLTGSLDISIGGTDYVYADLPVANNSAFVVENL